LLTVLEHEFGHLLGFEHDTRGLMSDVLPAGVRRIPHRVPIGRPVPKPVGSALGPSDPAYELIFLIAWCPIAGGGRGERLMPPRPASLRSSARQLSRHHANGRCLADCDPQPAGDIDPDPPETLDRPSPHPCRRRSPPYRHESDPDFASGSARSFRSEFSTDPLGPLGRLVPCDEARTSGHFLCVPAATSGSYSELAQMKLVDFFSVAVGTLERRNVGRFKSGVPGNLVSSGLTRLIAAATTKR
jgi:hypothetical protein